MLASVAMCFWKFAIIGNFGCLAKLSILNCFFSLAMIFLIIHQSVVLSDSSVMSVGD
jgi:hypothetical protein